MTPAEYLSIEQVARRLQLHVRTVRTYVRSGRLKAVRVGKQYRIAPRDLAAFTGVQVAASPADSVLRRRHTEMIAVVQIDVIDNEESVRITDAVRSGVQGWFWPHARLQFLPLYDHDRKRLKLILAGDLLGISNIIETIQLFAGRTHLPTPGRLRSPRARR